MTSRLLAPLLGLGLLAGCGPGDMARQEKVSPYDPGEPVSGHLVPPEGTVPQSAAAAPPPPADGALLARGAERFAIFCSPCHGARGDGNGRTPTIPPPPDFHDPRLAEAPAEHFVRVMTVGIGRMYPFAGRIPEVDRWAIARWIKHMQAGGR